MTRKRQESVERRRPLLEMNLIGESKSRSAGRRKGCLPFTTIVVVGVAVAAAVAAGLH